MESGEATVNHWRHLASVIAPAEPKGEAMVKRTLYVAETTWDRAKVRADEKGETVSEAVRKFLERYVR